MTAAEFKAAMPAFASTDDPTIERHIARSGAYFDANAWGDLLADGRNYWLAHEIVTEAALGATPGTAGASSLATEKKVGQVAVKFSDAAIEMQAKDPYLRTGYGQKFRELQRLAGIGAVVV